MIESEMFDIDWDARYQEERIEEYADKIENLKDEIETLKDLIKELNSPYYFVQSLFVPCRVSETISLSQDKGYKQWLNSQ